MFRCQSRRSFAGYFVICPCSTIDTIARAHISCEYLLQFHISRNSFENPISLALKIFSRWLPLQWYCTGQSIRWSISSVLPHGFSTEALWSLWLWCVIQNRIIQGPTRYAIEFSTFFYRCRTSENQIFITQVSVVLNGKCTVTFNRKKEKKPYKSPSLF